MARRCDLEKMAFWRGVLERQVVCGLTVAEFCRREGLVAASFYRWRRKLATADQAGEHGRVIARGADRAVAGLPRLLPVQVLPESWEGQAAVEVVSPSGLVLRVREDAGIENVRRVLGLLHDLAAGGAHV